MRATAIVRTNSKRIERGRRRAARVQRRALDLHEVVDRHRLRDTDRGSRAARSAPARCARVSPMPTMPPQQTWRPASRTRSSVSSRSSYVARRDDLAVEIGRRVEVVVVVVEAGVAQLLRLAVLQHAERGAGLECRAPSPRAPSRARGRGRAASGRATRRPCRSASRRRPSRRARRRRRSSSASTRLVADAGVVARRLRAVAAVLGAAAGLDGDQRRQLHGVRPRGARDGPPARGT